MVSLVQRYPCALRCECECDGGKELGNHTLDGETSNSAFEGINEICSVKELSILSSELWKSGYLFSLFQISDVLWKKYI